MHEPDKLFDDKPATVLAWDTPKPGAVRSKCTACGWPALAGPDADCMLCGWQDQTAESDSLKVELHREAFYQQTYRPIEQLAPEQRWQKRLMDIYTEAERAADCHQLNPQQATAITEAEQALAARTPIELTMDVSDFKQHACAVCDTMWQFEQEQGTYDVLESQAAISTFKAMIEGAKATTVHALIAELRDACDLQQKSDGPLDGAYNGGKATYGSILSRLECVYDGDIPVHQKPALHQAGNGQPLSMSYWLSLTGLVLVGLYFLWKL